MEVKTDHSAGTAWFFFFFGFLFSGVAVGLEIEPGAFHMLGKCSTQAISPAQHVFYWNSFMGCYVA